METTDNQTGNSRPWLWKKGQSGNPKGRPKGKTAKERVKEYLTTMTDDEFQEFLAGMNKETIWKMAEGNPATATDITTNGKDLPTPIININRDAIHTDNSIRQDSETE